MGAFRRTIITLTKSVAIGGLLALLLTYIIVPDSMQKDLFRLLYKVSFAASFYTVTGAVMLPRWSGIPIRKRFLLFVKLVVLPLSEIHMFEMLFCGENSKKPSIFERFLFSDSDLDLFEDNDKDEDDVDTDEDVWYK